MARADLQPERYMAQVKPQEADPARTPISRGTKSSNPLPSTGESDANSVHDGGGGPSARRRSQVADAVVCL
jgi:hypothetical protein